MLYQLRLEKLSSFGTERSYLCCRLCQMCANSCQKKQDGQLPRVAENYTTRPLPRAQKLMTHPPSAPTHPPPQPNRFWPVPKKPGDIDPSHDSVTQHRSRIAMLRRASYTKESRAELVLVQEMTHCVPHSSHHSWFLHHMRGSCKSLFLKVPYSQRTLGYNEGSTKYRRLSRKPRSHVRILI